MRGSELEDGTHSQKCQNNTSGLTERSAGGNVQESSLGMWVQHFLTMLKSPGFARKHVARNYNLTVIAVRDDLLGHLATGPLDANAVNVARSAI